MNDTITGSTVRYEGSIASMRGQHFVAAPDPFMADRWWLRDPATDRVILEQVRRSSFVVVESGALVAVSPTEGRRHVVTVARNGLVHTTSPVRVLLGDREGMERLGWTFESE